MSFLKEVYDLRKSKKKKKKKKCFTRIFYSGDEMLTLIIKLHFASFPSFLQVSFNRVELKQNKKYSMKKNKSFTSLHWKRNLGTQQPDISGWVLVYYIECFGLSVSLLYRVFWAEC